MLPLLPIAGLAAVAAGWVLYKKKKEADKPLFQMAPPSSKAPSGMKTAPTPAAKASALANVAQAANTPAKKATVKQVVKQAAAKKGKELANKLKATGAAVGKVAEAKLQQKAEETINKTLENLAAGKVSFAGPPDVLPLSTEEKLASLAAKPEEKRPPTLIPSAPTVDQKEKPLVMLSPNPEARTPGPTPPISKLDQASELAERVRENILENGRDYDRRLVAEFQDLAELGVDGRYGGRTAGALLYFTGEAPPAPYHKPKVVIQYRPRGL